MSTPPSIDHPLGTETAVFAEHRYGLSQPTGTVNVDTVVTHGLAMAKHEQWEPGFTEVWDLRFSGAVDIRPRDLPMILKLEGWTKEELKGSETIIIANRSLLEGIIQLYAMVVKPFGRVVRSVRTEEQAAEILGIVAIPALSEGARKAVP